MAQTSKLYPFSAIVGQEDLQLALILCAVQPRIGGVVIRGEKGTAKTTTVRGFAQLISGPLVNLPLGATEDRVIGSIDVETVLTTGKASYQPGLLAAADGGILYVDEVNLLADHLVDALLDAAATGQVTVERDNISFSSNANFVLVGTMNPEEGELRPQLLDRFGLAVEVAASREVAARTEIIRRRLAFEANPAQFCQAYEEQNQQLAQQIAAAQALLPQVELSEAMLGQIAHLCAAFDCEGLRADLVIARTAAAHAAYQGRTEVVAEDLAVAANLALPHRKRRNPFDEPGLDPEELAEKLQEAQDAYPSTEPQEPQQPQADADNQTTAPSDQPHQPGNAEGGPAASGTPFCS